MNAKVWLQRKTGGNYHLRVVIEGREYQRSLETSEADEADAYICQAKQTLHLIRRGQLEMPSDVAPIDFLISGGKHRLARASKGAVVTLEQARDDYLADETDRASDAYLSSQRTHLRHLITALGGTKDIRTITLSDLSSFLKDRRKNRTAQTTIRERNTFRKFFAWMAKQRLILDSPAKGLPVIKDDSKPRPFRTAAQVNESVRREQLKDRPEKQAWKAVFLSAAEIATVLATVKGKATDLRSFLLHALAAYTGMRRGEILRLRWADLDFEFDTIIARSRKQSRARRETLRRIELHPELKAILVGQREKNPTGEFVVCHADTLAPLTTDQANRLFWSPLRNTTWMLDSKRNWCKIGFHTYRHSFVSNLALNGVDQRVIKEFVGHTSDAMQWRYLHLFPNQRQEAIRSFSLLGGSP